MLENYEHLLNSGRRDLIRWFGSLINLRARFQEGAFAEFFVGLLELLLGVHDATKFKTRAIFLCLVRNVRNLLDDEALRFSRVIFDADRVIEDHSRLVLEIEVRPVGDGGIIGVAGAGEGDVAFADGIGQRLGALLLFRRGTHDPGDTAATPG